MQQKPAYIATVQAHDAGLSKRVTDVRDFVLKEGALSPKIKTLMMMLCDALLARGAPSGYACLFCAGVDAWLAG